MCASLVRIFAIGLCLAACASAASAAEPPRGKIVYRAPSGDLWTMNADSSHCRGLTRSGAATETHEPQIQPRTAPFGHRTAQELLTAGTTATATGRSGS
jgi:hypothetical protein